METIIKEFPKIKAHSNSKLLEAVEKVNLNQLIGRLRAVTKTGLPWSSFGINMVT